MSDPLLPIGSNRCRCAACGRYFGAPSSFDRHQSSGWDGRTICHDPAARGLVFDGRYWRSPGERPPRDGARSALLGKPRSDETEGVAVVTLARQECLL